MPWVNAETCTGCSICIEECPVGAISIGGETAFINMEECVRCGTCHEICPEEAVRHDGEKVPADVKANVERTKECMDTCTKHFRRSEEAGKCLDRWIKHYNREKIVAEKTIEELQLLKSAL